MNIILKILQYTHKLLCNVTQKTFKMNCEDSILYAYAMNIIML